MRGGCLTTCSKPEPTFLQKNTTTNDPTGPSGKEPSVFQGHLTRHNSVCQRFHLRGHIKPAPPVPPDAPILLGYG
jgi:hypothetical protein